MDWSFDMWLSLIFAGVCWGVALGGLVAIWRDCRAERRMRREH